MEAIKSEPVCDQLFAMLPYFAGMVIEDRPENENFKQNPDDPTEHVVNWHQFGIITHTSVFLTCFRKEACTYFESWGISRKMESRLQEQIDGKSRSELLEISIVFHDLGKFVRSFKETDGKTEHSFHGHEAISENLIEQNEFIHNLLQDTFGLTKNQIRYIAKCAGLHFELGKARDAARTATHGYSIAFANSALCELSCNSIAAQFPEFKTEIGILFLCDSLAKSDVRIIADTDEQIEAQIHLIEGVIRKRGLNRGLTGAIRQMPVNIAIARKYLEIV